MLYIHLNPVCCLFVGGVFFFFFFLSFGFVLNIIPECVFSPNCLLEHLRGAKVG